MNQAVTIGVKKKDGKLTFAIITDPNTPHRDQRRNFRNLRRELHGKFDEVQLWTSSSGRVKRQNTTDRALTGQPVEAEEVSGVEGADLLSLDATTSDPVAAAQAPANSDGNPVPSPVPNKRAEALKKAQAAAAAKRAAKTAAQK